MNFPSRDLLNQPISSSFQDVLQRYGENNVFYILDGRGNVLFTIPSASLNYTLITSDITSSMVVLSASYSQTSSVYQLLQQSSSFASRSISASYSENSDYSLAAFYAVQSTSASYALTASYVSGSSNASISASYSLTASYALNGGGSSNSASYAITASYSNEASRLTDSGLSIPKYDYSMIEYNAPLDQFSRIEYRLGGISGSIVSVLTGIYSGSIFIGVSKSLS